MNYPKEMEKEVDKLLAGEQLSLGPLKRGVRIRRQQLEEEKEGKDDEKEEEE